MTRLAADRAEALDRLGEKCSTLPEGERAAYLFLCMAILGNNAPEVLHFILDRADERLAEAEES